MNSIIMIMPRCTTNTSRAPQQNTNNLIELRQVLSNISEVIHQTGKVHTKVFFVCILIHLIGFRCTVVSRRIAYTFNNMKKTRTFESHLKYTKNQLISWLTVLNFRLENK